mmetsp:Transcript_25150/g.29236  ORF Transcript_25150/g.29236 Transcript_25150/m.29236 type:complete len:96 (+) Transcript_25150:45-332(+)
MQSASAILKDQEKVKAYCKTIFDSADADKSGKIDKKELASLMSKVSAGIGMPNPTQEDVVNVLKNLDTNKDGELSLEEFKALVITILEQYAAQGK